MAPTDGDALRVSLFVNVVLWEVDEKTATRRSKFAVHVDRVLLKFQTRRGGVRSTVFRSFCASSGDSLDHISNSAYVRMHSVHDAMLVRTYTYVP